MDPAEVNRLLWKIEPAGQYAFAMVTKLHDLLTKLRERNVSNLAPPERHQLDVARRTLKMSPAMQTVMGGPTCRDAWFTVHRLTGKWPTRDECHRDVWFRMMSTGGGEFDDAA